MNEKTSAAVAPGAVPAKPKTAAPAEVKSKKGFDFETLTKAVNQRSTLDNHLSQLAKRKGSVDFVDVESNDENMVLAIELNFGSRHNNYTIKNPNLLLEVTNFLEAKIKERIKSLETEIEVLTALN